MSFVPQGTVYGTLLNFRTEWAALRAQMDQPPYKAPPQAPVLYIKPANTWSAHGAAIAVPPRVPQVEIGATIGMVMGAGGTVAGHVLMNDLSIPHASFFRPPVKFKCLDGFLGLGEHATLLPDVADTVLEVRINGALVQTVRCGDMVRPAAQLLADVGEFMTLRPGDVLMLGCDVLATGRRPLAQVGDRMDISAPGLGTLTNTLIAEAR